MKSIVNSFLAVCLTGMVASAANGAAIYTEDFESGTGGWFTVGPTNPATGGVGDSAYLRGSRAQHLPSFATNSAPATTNLNGDLEAMYGSNIKISYYGKIFSVAGGMTGVRDVINTTGTSWARNYISGSNASAIAAFFSDWTLVEFEVNTNWTDVEAAANGWSKVSGTGTWTDLWNNVIYMEYMSSVGGTTGTKVAGFDNFRIESVEIPEPSSIVLIALAFISLGAFTCVRRKTGRRSQ